MGRQEDGSAVRAVVLDLCPDRAAGLDIQARRRLVEEDRVRLAGERERDRKPPPLSAREPSRLPPRNLLEREPLEQVVGTGREREMRADEVDDLTDTERRRKARFLWRRPHGEPRVRPARIEAEDVGAALVWAPEA